VQEGVPALNRKRGENGLGAKCVNARFDERPEIGNGNGQLREGANAINSKEKNPPRDVREVGGKEMKNSRIGNGMTSTNVIPE
jgi:hypothetical protein